MLDLLHPLLFLLLRFLAGPGRILRWIGKDLCGQFTASLGRGRLLSPAPRQDRAGAGEPDDSQEERGGCTMEMHGDAPLWRMQRIEAGDVARSLAASAHDPESSGGGPEPAFRASLGFCLP